MTITIAILALTCIISFTAFSNEKITEDLIFYPPAIANRNQWYRFITCGFIHADIMHLAFNMYTFYLFGGIVERYFTEIFGGLGRVIYVLLYLSALIVCLLPTYLQHKENYYYRSLGASGAVSAVIFIGIFLNPTMLMGIFPIPFHIPGFIFGPIYLALSAYLAKRGHGNINHSAHIWGAIYGIVFIIVTCQFLTDFRPIEMFINQVSNYIKSF
ncbi:MAG: rhomboid family intramembrane serine protease [Chitinophagaceae bacterium]|nr:rhomboid family intramembrane serine protease [Chitinophagaceae bacterium]